ncbi:hypothetical protein BH23CHL5_BH23CHL5_20480 [soil metagenome]
MNPDPEKPDAATDPRMLLPEWLRDSDNDLDSGPAPGMNIDDATIQPIERRSPAATSPTPGWGPLPDSHASFEPSMLVQLDDLPAWIRKLPPDALQPHRQAAESADFQEFMGTRPNGTVPALALEGGPVTNYERADDQTPVRQSDLSMTGFAWISGTSLLILALALIVILR